MARSITLFAFLFLLTAICNAQPGPPPDPDVPITGIEILLALGGVLGIRKFLSGKKNAR